jgi:hypothetical protein
MQQQKKGKQQQHQQQRQQQQQVVMHRPLAMCQLVMHRLATFPSLEDRPQMAGKMAANEAGASCD